jgi:cytochrome b subunit of formate dehydrogenase
MSLNTDQESLHSLLFTHDLYVNPRDEHKYNNIKIRLVIVFIIMLFFLLLISSVVILVRTAPIEQFDSTTTFSTDK